MSIFLVFITVSAFGADTPYDDPTAIGIGARPLGMGRAFVAVVDDSNAIFMNPAGLANQNKWAISSMNTNLLETYQYTMLSSVFPTNDGVWGLGVVSSMVGDINVTTDGGGKATFSNRAIVLSYARYIGDKLTQYLGREENISGGVNLKYYSKEFSGDTSASGSGLNFDLGLKYQPKDWISYGINFQNIFFGSKITGDIQPEDMPFAVKAGAAFYWTEQNVIFALDKDMFFGREIPWPNHLGAEWKLHPNLTLRGGFDQVADAQTGDLSTNNTFGIGLNYNGFTVNLSYMQNYSELSLASNIISISFMGDLPYSINNKPSSEANKPAPVQPAPVVVQQTPPPPPPTPTITPTQAASVPAVPLKENKSLASKITMNPPDRISTLDPSITFSGSVDPDISEVDIDQIRAEIRQDKTFEQAIALTPGRNVKIVRIVDGAGDEATMERKLVRFYLPSDVPLDEGNQRDIRYKVIFTELYSYLGKNYTMDKKISREILALVIAKAKKLDISAPSAQVATDVSATYWSASLINAALKNGIMSLYNNGEFKPDKIVTIAELVHIMSKATGYEMKFPAWKALNGDATMSDLIDTIYSSGMMNDVESEYRDFLGVPRT